MAECAIDDIHANPHASIDRRTGDRQRDQQRKHTFHHSFQYNVLADTSAAAQRERFESARDSTDTTFTRGTQPQSGEKFRRRSSYSIE